MISFHNCFSIWYWGEGESEGQWGLCAEVAVRGCGDVVAGEFGSEGGSQEACCIVNVCTVLR